MKYMIYALSLALAVILSGCSLSNLSNQTSVSSQTDTLFTADKGLLSIFPSKVSKKEIRYQGMSEYGQVQILKRLFDMNRMRVVNYQGWMEDGMGGSKEERKFYIDYYITENEIIEGIKNLDQLQPKKSNKLMSIIPKQIVLQTPLERNHSWTQEFDYDPARANPIGEHQHLKAEYTITDIEKKNGNLIFTVETVVKNIEGFYNNTYKETKRWQVGKGLISFTQSIPIYQGFEGNEEDAENFLTFGYSLVK